MRSPHLGALAHDMQPLGHHGILERQRRIDEHAVGVALDDADRNALGAAAPLDLADAEEFGDPVFHGFKDFSEALEIICKDGNSSTIYRGPNEQPKIYLCSLSS